MDWATGREYWPRDQFPLIVIYVIANEYLAIFVLNIMLFSVLIRLSV